MRPQAEQIHVMPLGGLGDDFRHVIPGQHGRFDLVLSVLCRAGHAKLQLAPRRLELPGCRSIGFDMQQVNRTPGWGQREGTGTLTTDIAASRRVSCDTLHSRASGLR